MRHLSVCASLTLAVFGLATGLAVAQQARLDRGAALAVTRSRSTASGEKAVPRADKAAVDVVGRLVDFEILTDDECGTGTQVLVLYVQVGRSFVSATSACNSLQVGQRARFQGGLAVAPDPTAPRFDPCDANTWEVGPINVFAVTKISK
jgi:hypothetical protein